MINNKMTLNYLQSIEPIGSKVYVEEVISFEYLPSGDVIHVLFKDTINDDIQRINIYNINKFQSIHRELLINTILND